MSGVHAFFLVSCSNLVKCTLLSRLCRCPSLPSAAPTTRSSQRVASAGGRRRGAHPCGLNRGTDANSSLSMTALRPVGQADPVEREEVEHAIVAVAVAVGVAVEGGVCWRLD